MAPTEAVVFHSRYYPGTEPRRWLLTRWLVQPIAFCMLPVMVGALIAVLQGLPALPFLTVGFPLALVLAGLWTWTRLHTTLAIIAVRPGTAAIRSVWETYTADDALEWQPIYELRQDAQTASVALGDATYTLWQRNWPDFPGLMHALKEARHASLART